MIKLVVCDMDGTMIGRDMLLPKEAPALVQSLKDRGVLFTLASGRSQSFVAPYLEKLKVAGFPYIACNGATILQGEHPLIQKQFPVYVIRNLIETSFALGLSLILTINGRERVIRMTNWILHEGCKMGIAYREEPFTEEEWQSVRIEKAMLMDEQQDGKIEIVEGLCKTQSQDFTYVRYRAKAIELTERTANKGEGLKELLKILEMKPSQVLAVGDDQNDVEMLTFAGIGAVVANGSRDAREAADYVCAGERFSGVTEAVQKFVLQDREPE